jgi:putative ABC transport system ATP-binding protein
MAWDITALGEDALASCEARRSGSSFSSFHLIPSLTAYENVAVPMEIAGESDPRGRAEALLEEVGLTGRAHHYPSQLSGGEQQRVALARALANDPPLIWPTNRRATSTPPTAATSWSCCGRSTTSAARPSCS